MEHELILQLQSQPKLLCSVRRLVRAYVMNAGFTPERSDEVVLAVDEALANSIRHSYGGRDNEEIVLRFSNDEAGVEIELEDHGLPAPAEVTRPREAAAIDAERLEPGGLGVHLMYSVFDELKFVPGAERGNRVSMRLHRKNQ